MISSGVMVGLNNGNIGYATSGGLVPIGSTPTSASPTTLTPVPKTSPNKVIITDRDKKISETTGSAPIQKTTSTEIATSAEERDDKVIISYTSSNQSALVDNTTLTDLAVTSNPNESIAVWRCPYCFSTERDTYTGLKNYTHDPILTANGTNLTLNIKTDTFEEGLSYNYKGFYNIKNIDIIELQNKFRQLEIDVGVEEVERTTFSTITDNKDGIWIANKNHIQELRDSVEKILEACGLTKEEFFNYDENGKERRTEHQLDWKTPELDKWKGHILYNHIEDLRHPIVTLPWERFSVTPIISDIDSDSDSRAGNSGIEDESLSVNAGYNVPNDTLCDTKNRLENTYFPDTAVGGIVTLDYTNRGKIWQRSITPPFDRIEPPYSWSGASNVSVTSNCSLTNNVVITGSIHAKYDLRSSTPPIVSSDYEKEEVVMSGVGGANLYYNLATEKAVRIVQGLKLSIDLSASVVLEGAENGWHGHSGNCSIRITGNTSSLYYYTGSTLSNIDLNLYDLFVANQGREPTENDKVTDIEINVACNIFGETTEFIQEAFDLTATYNLNVDNIKFYRG